MKSKIILVISAFFSLALVSCAFQDQKMPDTYETYENVEWVEISRAEAVKISSTYDKSMRYGTLTVWQKWFGTKPQKFVGCLIDGDSYERAEGMVVTMTIGRLTIDHEIANESALFFKMKGNNSVIKIEIPSDSDAEHYYLDIYKDGWCIVRNSYIGLGSYEKYFIKYDWY